jgi:hypothetical protein
MRETLAPKPPSFAALVQTFFTEYLVAQRALSPRRKLSCPSRELFRERLAW